MDPLDSALLSLIQSGVPLVREPLAAIAGELACGERTVLERLRALRSPRGIIRQIAGIFDAPRLGYAQALVAFRLAPAGLDAAGAIVAEHPGVSHCYGREGPYNLWFTLAVSPASALGLEKTVGVLARRSGALGQMVLPTLRRYKLDVQLGGGEEARPASPRQQVLAGSYQTPAGAPTEEQVRAIRALQIDLPLQPDPFGRIAQQAGLDADALLAHATDFLARGWMRRYAAVLHHRAAGAKANVMVVWRVDEADADAAGEQCAQFGAVSHCYLRPACADWPYSLYTMIHGPTREDCQATIGRIAAAIGRRDRLALWTAREYKKRRVRLFTDAERQWEDRAEDS